MLCSVVFVAPALTMTKHVVGMLIVRPNVRTGRLLAERLALVMATAPGSVTLVKILAIHVLLVSNAVINA